ncbi:fimbrial protein [Stenotrophomonas sp.]|uniref:fimbrial protein n=1 Tax=Stenotrophomonas sp. TaxID=69392 RepID=UPI00289B0A59|nr:fimbrial protein [Stenotrophomonas sp.]
MLHFTARRRRWPLACSLVLPMALLACQAYACHRFSPQDRAEDAILTMPNLDMPDRYFTGRGETIQDAFDCPAGQSAILVDMSLSGLTYERDLVWEGSTYPAYSLGERSPLVIFTQATFSGANGSSIALHNGRINRNPGLVLATPGRLDHFVQMRVFFRGGAMRSVPYTALGTIEAWSENDPTNRFRHSFGIEVTLPAVTCTLADASHGLDDVSADDLAAMDSSAKESGFEVSMTCPMDNVDVELSVADANDPGSRDGLLAPAPGATAEGVRVQLLREGVPVQFGQRWRYGWSSKGAQRIPFRARYRRTPDPLAPGVVKGEAVMTADYR